MSAVQAVQLHVKSCGSSHRGELPRGRFVLDVSTWFDDPSSAVDQRKLTAKDPAVVNRVRSAPRFLDYTRRLLELLVVTVDLAKGPVVLVLHCADGQQVSPVAADEVAELGRAQGWSVKVEHLDLGKPAIHAVRT
ncbi:RapZ C-terminal domain-containing protein [Lentzea chajnantorensis]